MRKLAVVALTVLRLLSASMSPCRTDTALHAEMLAPASLLSTFANSLMSARDCASLCCASDVASTVCCATKHVGWLCSNSGGSDVALTVTKAVAPSESLTTTLRGNGEPAGSRKEAKGEVD